MKTLILLLISSISFAQTYVKSSINGYGCVYVYKLNSQYANLVSTYNKTPPFDVRIPYQINNQNTLLSILREQLKDKDFRNYKGLGFTFYLSKTGEILEIELYGDDNLFFNIISMQDLYKIETEIKHRIFFTKISKYLINSHPIKYNFTINFNKIRQ